MKIKKNDTIYVLRGKDKGKTGKVLQVLPKENKASVEGINVTVKNLKSRKKGEKGQRISFPAPIAIANIALQCPKCGKHARIGFQKLTDGKKTRYCKKCKETID